MARLDDGFLVYWDMIDLNDPGDAATELVRSTRQLRPEVKIIVLGNCDAESTILSCIEAGAGACVSKESSLKQLCRVIERVLAGEAVYSPQIAYSMFTRLAELSRERARSERVEALELTPREMEVTTVNWRKPTRRMRNRRRTAESLGGTR